MGYKLKGVMDMKMVIFMLWIFLFAGGLHLADYLFEKGKGWVTLTRLLTIGIFLGTALPVMEFVSKVST